MNSILQQLKNNNKNPPKSWNISVEITEKIVKQKDQYIPMKKNYDDLKEKYDATKVISNKIYVINCMKENQQAIDELEKNKEDLKNRLQSKINESKELQEKIKENRIKKSNLKKENKELKHLIKKIKKKKESLNQNIENENPRHESVEDQKYDCELQLKYCGKVMKMINNMKNKRLKVQFTQPYNEEQISFPKAQNSKRFSRQLSVKPSFTNNQTRQRAKSFTGPSYHKNLELNSNNRSSSSQIIDFKTIDQHGCITAIHYSRTGRFYATGNENRKIYLYESGQCIPFERFNLDSSIISIDFNNEESLMLVACYNTIYLFDLYVINGRCHARQRPDKTRLSRIRHAEFVSSDQYIVCIDEMPIQLYKVGKKWPIFEEQFECKSRSTPYWAIGTNRGGIAGGYYDGFIRVFDPCSCDPIYEVHVHEGPIYQIISKDSIIISLSKDGTVAFTNIVTHEIEKRFPLRESGIIHNKTRMILFDDSLIVGGSNGLICEYDINSGKFISHWKKYHQTSISALDSNLHTVISGDQNGIVKLWYDRS